MSRAAARRAKLASRSSVSASRGLAVDIARSFADARGLA
jgi:hypothetical protein